MMKKITCMIAVLLCAFLVGMQVVAQPINECACTKESRGGVLARVPICVWGTKYVVDIEYCTDIYTVPVNDFPCNIPARTINAWTKITKICPSDPGVVLPAHSITFLAALCAMMPTGGDAMNYSWLVPAVGAGSFSWTIVYPKCITTDINGCIVACDETLCCTSRTEYKRDPSTGQILLTLILPSCATPDCPLNCETISCNLPVYECPTCP